jgi:hypothetical protein
VDNHQPGTPALRALSDDGIAHYVVHFTDRDLPSTPLRPTFLGWRDE